MQTKIFDGKQKQFAGLMGVAAILLGMTVLVIHAGCAKVEKPKKVRFQPTTISLTVNEQHAANISRLADKIRSLHLRDTALVSHIEQSRISGIQGNVRGYYDAADAAREAYNALDSTTQLAISSFVADSLTIPELDPAITAPIDDDTTGGGSGCSCTASCANGSCSISCRAGGMCLCNCDALGYPRCSCS